MATILPPDFPTGSVSGQFIFLREDGLDIGTRPDPVEVFGKVKFTASVPRLQYTGANGPALVVPLVFRGKINADGLLEAADDTGVLELPATNSDLLSPRNWTWHVEFDLCEVSTGDKINIPAFDFQVPEGTTVDLPSVVPVATSQGVITIRGPKGDVGPQGPPGNGVPAGGTALQILRKNAANTTTEWAPATANPTGETIAMRDVNGNLVAAQQVANALAPTQNSHTTRKDYVDNGLAGKVSKNELVVNVKDFGAVGDGITNDYSAIQAAIWYVKDTAPNTVSVIEFERNKTYNVGQKIYLYSNTDINLNWSTLRRTFNTGPGGVSLLQYENVVNLSLRNGTLDGNGANFPGVAGGLGFNISGGLNITNLSFSQVTFKDVIGAHSIDAGNVNGLYVDRCNFLGYKNTTPPDADRSFSEAIQLDPNALEGGSGSPVKRVRITNCYFGSSGTAGFGPVACGVGNHATVAGQVTSDVVIENNIFDSCTYAGVHPLRWENYRIESNTFIDCQAVLADAMPVTGSMPSRAFDGKILYNNVTCPIAKDAFIASWHTRLDFIGNTVNGCRNGFALRYNKHLNVVGNDVGNGVAGVWLNEATDTAYAGTGESYFTLIDSNKFSNLTGRGIHVNAGIRSTTVTNNKAYNTNTAANNTADTFAFDSASSDIFFGGNHTTNGNAPNKPRYGASFSVSCTDVLVGTNKLFGATGPISNLST